MSESITRFDRGVVTTKAIVTDEGFLQAQAIVTRTGVFNYQNKDGTIRKELRHPKDVLNSDSLQSLKMRPITNGHPSQKLVNVKNFKDLAVGYTGESVKNDGRYLSTNLLVTDPQAIKDITERKKTELSLGYTVDLIPEKGTYDGEDYTHRQTNIKYNHLALVDKARAGPEAKIHLDGQDAQEIEDSRNDYSLIHLNKEIITMSELNLSSVTLDGIDYKASPEVSNALKKANSEIASQRVNLDNYSIEIDKLKAERDSLKQQLDEAKKVNIDELVQVGIKKRVALIDSVKSIMGKSANEINFDSMSDKDIKIKVLKEKCPKINVDAESEVYLSARFDMLVEAAQEAETKESDNFGKQRQIVTTKADSATARDAKTARDEMKTRLYGKGFAKNAKDAKEAKDGNPDYKQAFCNK